MICLYYKYKPWEIDEISYLEYKDFITELSIFLSFESLKGISGNSYADSSKILPEINPMNYQDEKDKPKPKPTFDTLKGLGIIK